MRYMKYILAWMIFNFSSLLRLEYCIDHYNIRFRIMRPESRKPYEMKAAFSSHARFSFFYACKCHMFACIFNYVRQIYGLRFFQEGMTNILKLQHVRYNLQYNIEAKLKKK
jgi:hypothetical protein